MMSDYQGQTCMCVHCLGLQTARLKVDKRGRPYIRCTGCGATSFLPTGAALRGTVALAPYAVQAAQQAASFGYGQSLEEATQTAISVAQQFQQRSA